MKKKRHSRLLSALSVTPLFILCHSDRAATQLSSTMSFSAPKPPASTTTSSSSKPPKPPTPANPNPKPHHNPKAIIVYQENHALSRATFLTWSQLLWRRARRLKQLSRCYRHHYWAMMEELKARYKEYYWEYGVNPAKEQPQQLEDKDSGGDDNNNNNNNGVVEGCGESVELKHNPRCLFVGCKLKAMALTSFCHLHILSDSKQKLYKPCDYVIKSSPAGPITCGKPILRSTVPSLCTVHFQKAQKHVTRALKKAGLNVSSSSKLAPKFHVIVAEYVHQIQAKRRNALKKTKSEVVVKEEIAR